MTPKRHHGKKLHTGPPLTRLDEMRRTARFARKSDRTRSADSPPDPELLAKNTEALCELIIEALHELRAATTEPVTPDLLSRSITRQSSYLDTICSVARSAGPFIEPAEALLERLRGFQIGILRAFETAFGQECGPRPEELCRLAQTECRVEEIIALNSQILDLVRDVSGKAGEERREILELLAETARNLVEVERLVSVSYSSACKIHQGNQGFAQIVENHIQDIGDVLQGDHSVEELKGLIVSKLSAIREASQKNLQNGHHRKLTSEVEALRQQLNTLRNQIARTQKKAEKLEKVSLLDPLTGIANRRGLQKILRKEWDESKHSGDVFSVLVIDIDNFKLINDRFGHWAGDKCLLELVKRVKLSLRGTDFLSRLGGDEFVTVLPNTDQAGAATVAETLRRSIVQTRFLYGGERVPLTISIGLSTVQTSDQNFKAVLERADNALHNTKQKGRNCVSML